MKVLVATKEGQGSRLSDFHFREELEILRGQMVECHDEHVDGRCGCKRSLCGVNRAKATTTFTVEDRDITHDQYVVVLSASLEKQGFDLYAAGEMAANLADIASRFEPGDILERRGESIQKRPLELLELWESYNAS